MIVSPMNQLEHSLVVQKNITSVLQLRGKILGMSASGSLTDILLREGLRLNGVAEKDVTIIPIGEPGRSPERPADRPHSWGHYHGGSDTDGNKNGLRTAYRLLSAATGDFRIGKYWYDAPMSTRIPKSLIDF